MKVNRHVARVWKYPATTVGLATLLLLFGLGLCLQPRRWSATPAYGNLLDILSAPSWGVIYLTVSAAILLSLLANKIRFLAVTAHLAAFLLMLSWEAAFFVRWVTDPKTTVANVIAWAVYIALIARSAILINDDPEPDIDRVIIERSVS
jgi:hypothetical protein